MMLTHNNQRDERGFVLVTALLILVVLTIIGIAGSRNTSTELLIAGNDRTYKETFYTADGGADIAQEMLEQNLACIPGFKPKTNFDAKYNAAPYKQKKDAANIDIIGLNNGGLIDNFVFIAKDSLDLWRSFSPVNEPSDDKRSMFFPWNYDQGANPPAPHTNLTLAGDVKMTTGAAIQMAAGYEGKGKGISAGGTYLIYDMLSRHFGKNNSQVTIGTTYRHIIGTEGTCYY